MAVSFLIAAAATLLPAPEPVSVHKDWYAACDNAGTCEAGSLPDIVETYIRVQRAAGPDGDLHIRVTTQQEGIDRIALRIAGRDVATGRADGEATFLLAGDDLLSAARQLARGKTAVIVNRTPGTKGGDVIATISLAGSAAALRYTDVRQKRAGSRNAVVALGRARDRSVAEPLPDIENILSSEISGMPNAKALERLALQAGCPRPAADAQNRDTVHTLGRSSNSDAALAIVYCGAGAYNLISRAFVGTRTRADTNAPWTFAPARFDYPPNGFGESNTLVNAYFDAAGGVVGNYYKGRGLGDCGNTREYVWDGDMFRLVKATDMPVCRGVWQWPVIWRARPAHDAGSAQNKNPLKK